MRRNLGGLLLRRNHPEGDTMRAPTRGKELSALVCLCAIGQPSQAMGKPPPARQVVYLLKG